MTACDKLASVTPIVHPSGVDVKAPFRRFRRAGLVNARFAIDGREAFWGYHNAELRWNGWATPGFIREVAELIADWVNKDDPGTAWWDSEVLLVRSGDGEFIENITSDELGLYRFDGWIWLEADEQT